MLNQLKEHRTSNQKPDPQKVKAAIQNIEEKFKNLSTEDKQEISQNTDLLNHIQEASQEIDYELTLNFTNLDAFGNDFINQDQHTQDSLLGNSKPILQDLHHLHQELHTHDKNFSFAEFLQSTNLSPILTISNINQQIEELILAKLLDLSTQDLPDFELSLNSLKNPDLKDYIKESKQEITQDFQKTLEYIKLTNSKIELNQNLLKSENTKLALAQKALEAGAIRLSRMLLTNGINIKNISNSIVREKIQQIFTLILKLELKNELKILLQNEHFDLCAQGYFYPYSFFDIIGKTGSQEMIEVLIEMYGVNVKCSEGGTMLDVAVKENRIDIVNHLLKNGKLNINIVNNLGNTPLHSAIIAGNFQIIDQLLRRPEIDLSIKNNRSETVLDLVQDVLNRDPHNPQFKVLQNNLLKKGALSGR